MTKEQERAALEKIEKIINEAGPGSYIGMTFAGIVEQAADNITNDFANNYKELYEAQTKNLVEANKTIQALKDKRNDLKEQLKTVTGALEAAQASNKNLNEQLDSDDKEFNIVFNEREALKLENHNQKTEIITLKAKLYDLMTQ
jgi:septal ring factor EnvC (AmiA/AmiB activator)